MTRIIFLHNNSSLVNFNFIYQKIIYTIFLFYDTIPAGGKSKKFNWEMPEICSDTFIDLLPNTTPYLPPTKGGIDFWSCQADGTFFPKFYGKVSHSLIRGVLTRVEGSRRELLGGSRIWISRPLSLYYVYEMRKVLQDFHVTRFFLFGANFSQQKCQI